MKFLSSFRARLILTIFPVVAGVTTGAILLAEWRFGATYQRLFEEQFESQITASTLAKERRFNALSSVLERMAQKPALLEAMRRQDYAAASQDLRPALESLAQERLLNEGGSSSRRGTFSPLSERDRGPRRDDRDRDRGPVISRGDPRGGEPRDPSRAPGGGGMQSAPFISLINAQGDFVPSPRIYSHRQPQITAPGKEPSPDSNQPHPVRRRSMKIPWLSDQKIEEILDKQQVGYLLVDTGNDGRHEQVREVFITPMRDPNSGQFLGAFVFGLPLPALPDRVLFESSRHRDRGEIMSGIFVEGRLISHTMPEALQTVVEGEVSKSLTDAAASGEEILMSFADSSFRIICRVLNPDSPFPQAVQVNVYPLASLENEILALRRSAFTLGASALLVAQALVLLISRGLSGPIRRLVAATQEVERGNFDVRVPVTPDETGRLARAFNDMTAGLALQEKYRSILNAVADRTVAERLIENREALGGELRDVTMLFCDIRGFTTLTEKMPPHEVIELLNEHMTVLTQVAYDHGGIVDKFVGDLIMVLFGAPLTTGNDASRAVQCAQAMLIARQKQNATCLHPLEIGIGIASGSVVAVCMGSDQRLSYTVIGHRVNLASRLCHIAGPGEIVMDAKTATNLVPESHVEPLPAMQLKGMTEPVPVFRIR